MKYNNVPIIDQNKQNGLFVIIQKACYYFSYNIRDKFLRRKLKDKILYALIVNYKLKFV